MLSGAVGNASAADIAQLREYLHGLRRHGGVVYRALQLRIFGFQPGQLLLPFGELPLKLVYAVLLEGYGDLVAAVLVGACVNDVVLSYVQRVAVKPVFRHFLLQHGYHIV